METRPRSGRLTCLGSPSPWFKQFLGTLQQTGSFDIKFEAQVSAFLATPVPRSRVAAVILERSADAQETIETLRGSGRHCILIWAGKDFTKQDLVFAQKHRVHTVLESPRPDDANVLEQIRVAIGRAEASERAEGLIYSIKSVLLQLDDAENGSVLAELKTGLMKFEKSALHSEFLGEEGGVGTESHVPFHRGQAFADALLTVQDLERTGTLQVRGKQANLQGRVEFLQGRPVSAVCGEARGLKALFRMFLWEEAHFDFKRRAAQDAQVEEKMDLGLREICVEGEALCRRFDKIRSQLPPSQLRLSLEPSALHTGTKLDRPHFLTLSSVVELGKVSQILDYNPLPDVVLYECLIQLKRQGVIKVAPLT